MLNAKGNRELAYIVTIDEIKPIPNYDRVEYARVGGWWVIVRKDQFKVGDPAIYIEIDSKVPEKEPFMFLEKRHFKVKTLKMCKVVSQGLLMSPEDFGWEQMYNVIDNEWDICYEKSHYYKIGDFLTEKLGIVYADEEDNKRKAASADKYKLMAQRKPNIFKKKWARWIMRREWGRKIMFFFFGKKKDKKTWPQWVKKTDEERVQNCSWLFPGNDETEWIATEKIDGTSTTFTMLAKGKKYYVCSRNVVFDTPNKNCYYDTNVYLEMSEKYNVRKILETILKENKDLKFITLQGETYGANIQKRDYGLSEHNFMAFNVICGFKNGTVTRLNPVIMTEFLSTYDIPCVPILDEHYKIPKTCDEVVAYAGGASKIDGGMREGVVFRTYDGEQSFKAVDPEFLMKYHN